jgi:retron-type reverse transcriptase
MEKRSRNFLFCFSERSLRLAWERYIRSSQKEGKDYLGISIFEQDLDRLIRDLSRKIISGRYEKNLFIPPKFYKPKASGMQRTITILPIEDSLVCQAVANLVAQKGFDRLSRNNEFVLGNILSDGVAKGNKLLDQKNSNFFLFEPYVRNYKKFADSTSQEFRNAEVQYKLETDITGFYDTIPTHNLLSVLSDLFGVSGDILDLLEQCLIAWSGTRDGSTPGVGIPQSSDSSHLLANVYLHEVDEAMKASNLSYFRYMDDICIFGYKRHELEDALGRLDILMKSRGLSLNSQKTKIENISQEDKAKKIFRSFEYQIDNNTVNEISSNLESNDYPVDADVAEQSSSGNIYSNEDDKILFDNQSKQYDYLKIAQRDIQSVCNDLPDVLNRIKKFCENGNKIPRDIVNEALSLGFKYRVAQNVHFACKGKFKLKKANVRKYWLDLAEILFWRIDHICWVLAYFKNDAIVKRGLLNLLSKNVQFEWTRSEILNCLAKSQNFSVKELRQEIMPLLGAEKSWYPKRYIYKLLLAKCSYDNLFDTILASVRQEINGPLRREILFFSKLWESGDERSSKLLEIFDT